MSNTGTPSDTCTWTFDGNYWISVDDCAPGHQCADIVPDSSNPGQFVNSDGKALVGVSVKDVTDQHGKTKRQMSVPDDIFQQVAADRKITVPAVTAGEKADTHKVTLPCV